MDLRSSGGADQLPIEEQNQVSAFTPTHTAQVFEERRKLAKKDKYLLDNDSTFSKDSSLSDFEEVPRLSRRFSHHRRLCQRISAE